MPDLILEVEGNNLVIELNTSQGVDWCLHENGDYANYQIGDKVKYPLTLQDMLVQELLDQGLALDYER